MREYYIFEIQAKKGEKYNCRQRHGNGETQTEAGRRQAEREMEAKIHRPVRERNKDRRKKGHSVASIESEIQFQMRRCAT